MRKRPVFIIAILMLMLQGMAQQPEEVLAKWADRYPIEKIHLHMDRQNYLAGETARFKAYLYSDYQPDTISTTLYIELISDSSTVLCRKVLPVLFGATNGHIEIPDSLYTGTYFIRAWTPTMLNHDPEYIFKRGVFIYGKKNWNTASLPPPAKKTRLEFFPEGGNLVSGLSNTVAFKATNEKGLPVNISGALFNEKNEQLTKFSSYHDGMGMFDLTPVAGQELYVSIDGDWNAEKYYLPASTVNGIAITLIPHPQGHFFELKQAGSDPVFQAAYMVGQMQHHLVFRQEFKSGKQEMQGVINTKHLHSGILQVTLFNKAGMPLAERLCFVNNKEYKLEGELLADTIAFSTKARNRFRVKLNDTIQGNFSVSVSDADYDILPRRLDNIHSQFLLSADLKGYIHDPAYYFLSDNDSTSTALDLVMMTNGWRRFNWSALPKNPVPVSYNDPGFINLSGKVTLRDVKKPFDSKPILVYIIGSDSARTMMMTKTDKDGKFQLDSLLFFGPAKIVFGDIRGKKSQYIDVHLSSDSLTKAFILPGINRRPISLDEMIPVSARTRMTDDYDAIRKADGLMLEGVTIKVKRKSPIEELEERYASGMFSGFSEKTYDLTNNKDAVTYANIFEYLRFTVPGLDVGTNVDGGYLVYYRQGVSISSMGPIPMTLYLNEIETDANVIATITPAEIALVKVYSSFVGAVGNGAGGVMAIYTKKGEDLFDATPTHVDRQRYTGFSVIKEFYSPDYKAEPSAINKEDNRITLQWKPDILVTGVNPMIPVVFYNNDRTKRFRVIVEGMTAEGKMVMIEKVFEPKGF